MQTKVTVLFLLSHLFPINLEDSTRHFIKKNPLIKTEISILESLF